MYYYDHKMIYTLNGELSPTGDIMKLVATELKLISLKYGLSLNIEDSGTVQPDNHTATLLKINVTENGVKWKQLKI